MDTAVYRRSVQRGWSFLMRARGWKLSACGVAASLLLLQLLLVTFAGLRLAESSAFERGAVHLEVESGTIDQRVQELYANLRSLPSVFDVTFMTSEQVLIEEQARDASLFGFLEQYGMENPFTDIFVVVPRNGRAYEELRRFVEQENDRGGIGVTALAEITAKERAAADVIGAFQMIRMGVGLLILLVLVTSFFLSTSVLAHLRFHRTTIIDAEVMMGAEPSVIAMPVVTAGIIVVIGALITATLLAVVIVYLLSLFSESASMSDWLSHAAWMGIAPAAPVVIGCEAALLALLACIVGRCGFRI